MYKHCFKRVFDIMVGLLALPFVLILIVLVGPIIYLTDKGPIFYCGERVGKNGHHFKMVKLRSMFVNSPDIRNADGSTFNSNKDSRVTPIGRILRKTSLDEFPQFLNVLMGDMSIVGPRPTVALDLDVSIADEMTKKRYSVRPGITGFAQAYFRNSITQDEKLKWNCYYVDHLSFLLDLKILWKTVISVLAHENINAE